MICNQCKLDKKAEDYYNRYKTCKECIKKKQRERNKDDKLKKRNGNKKCKKCEEIKDINLFRINRGECLNCEKKYGRKYNKKNKHIRDKWQNENKEHHKKLQANWYQNNKNKINEKYNRRYKNDICFKINQDQRRILLNHITKIKRTKEYLGNEFKIIKKWLEKQFDNNMSWDNHGEYWEIDHVLPIANFDLTNEKDIEVCFNWKNLMPLKKEINSNKKNKVIEKQVKLQIKRLKAFFTINEIEEDLNNYLIKYQHYFATHLAAGTP